MKKFEIAGLSGIMFLIFAVISAVFFKCEGMILFLVIAGVATYYFKKYEKLNL